MRYLSRVDQKKKIYHVDDDFKAPLDRFFSSRVFFSKGLKLYIIKVLKNISPHAYINTNVAIIRPTAAVHVFIQTETHIYLQIRDFKSPSGAQVTNFAPTATEISGTD